MCFFFDFLTEAAAAMMQRLTSHHRVLYLCVSLLCNYVGSLAIASQPNQMSYHRVVSIFFLALILDISSAVVMTAVSCKGNMSLCTLGDVLNVCTLVATGTAVGLATVLTWLKPELSAADGVFRVASASLPLIGTQLLKFWFIIQYQLPLFPLSRQQNPNPNPTEHSRKQQ